MSPTQSQKGDAVLRHQWSSRGRRGWQCAPLRSSPKYDATLATRVAGSVHATTRRLEREGASRHGRHVCACLSLTTKVTRRNAHATTAAVSPTWREGLEEGGPQSTDTLPRV